MHLREGIHHEYYKVIQTKERRIPERSYDGFYSPNKTQRNYRRGEAQTVRKIFLPGGGENPTR